MGASCLCSEGYYGTSKNFTTCLASLCGTCSGGISCDTCAMNAKFQKSACVCKLGYYLSGSSCVACDLIDTLLKCDASGANLTCKDNSTKNGVVMNALLALTCAVVVIKLSVAQTARLGQEMTKVTVIALLDATSPRRMLIKFF